MLNKQIHYDILRFVPLINPDMGVNGQAWWDDKTTPGACSRLSEIAAKKAWKPVDI